MAGTSGATAHRAARQVSAPSRQPYRFSGINRRMQRRYVLRTSYGAAGRHAAGTSHSAPSPARPITAARSLTLSCGVDKGPGGPGSDMRWWGLGRAPSCCLCSPSRTASRNIDSARISLALLVSSCPPAPCCSCTRCPMLKTKRDIAPPPCLFAHTVRPVSSTTPVSAHSSGRGRIPVPG